MGWQVETEEWSWGEKKSGAPPPSLEISGMTPVVFYHPISRGTVSFVGLGEVCGQGKRGELEAGGGEMDLPHPQLMRTRLASFPLPRQEAAPS